LQEVLYVEKVDNRREKIYRYIVKRIGEGYAPTVREICKDLSIPSTSTVHSDLRFLAESGSIIMSDGLGRAIRLPGESSRLVPLVGTVAAGSPILAVENIEQYIPLAAPHGRGDDLFALRVRGDSMVGAAILEDDIVVVEKSPTAENGQLVVALVEDEATVKRYYKEDGRFRLQPENDAYPPILLDEVTVLGRVVSVLRFYS